MGTVRTEAFVYLGGPVVLFRNPLLLSEISRRGLAILVIAPRNDSSDRVLRRVADPAHPCSLITEVSFVEPRGNFEGAYNAAVLKQFHKWRSQYNIRGVCAFGETFVEPAGIMADILNLPSPGLRASRVCRSKYLQRLYLEEWSPPWVVLPSGVREQAAEEFGIYPAVLKPTSRDSSSGVIAINTPADLQDALPRYPPEETLLLEARVHGSEHSVETLVQDGCILFSSITQKRTTESYSSYFVEIGHGVPDPDLDGSSRSQILAATKAVVQGLELQDGVVHAEWRNGSDGRVYLMEIAARPAGDGLLALYHLSTGVPMESEIVRIALGEPAHYPAPRRYARQVYLDVPRSVLHDVTVDWPGIAPVWIAATDLWPKMKSATPDEPPQLRSVVVLKALGARIDSLTQSEDRTLCFFIDAPTVSGLNDIEQAVRRAIHVRTLPERAINPS